MLRFETDPDDPRNASITDLDLAPRNASGRVESAADFYLLKSHAPQALEVAKYLEQCGARVVNGWAATAACQDRILMTGYMNKAGLLWPHTCGFSSLKDLLEQDDLLATLSFPLIIKSRYSHRYDLVDKLHNVDELQALAPQWAHCF